MQLLISIVVSGPNMMGDPLAEVNAVLVNGKKVVRSFEHQGPVASHEAVLDLITRVFKDGGE